MNRPLSNLVKDIIKQQSTQVDAIGNLYGTPLVFERGPEALPSQGTWRKYELNTLDIYSPDDIINKVSSIQLRAAPVVLSNEGILDIPTNAGTTLISTMVNLPQAIGFTVQIFCANKQVALYVGENLVRRGTNSLITTINLPAGKSPVNIVVYGGAASELIVQIPNDLVIGIGDFIPPVPRLLDSGAINTAYVDPKTGATGVSISWYNQENVGGWGVYSVRTTPFGTISSVLSVAGKYIITTNYSGVGPYDSSVVEVGNILLGTVESSTYNDEKTSLVLTINAVQHGFVDLAPLNSGTLNVLTFQNLQNILRISQADIVTFVDTNVAKGTKYTYCLDSFAPGDSGLRSNKTPFFSITAGDIYPPASITLLTVSVDSNKRLTATYITPPDLDYYSTKVVYYYQGSGTGAISNVNVLTDVGIPSTQDSLIFPGITSGTFYFITSDVVNNTQYVLSGVPYYWNGSGQSNAAANTPPTISVAQLSAEQMTLDPKLWAQFLITGNDIETPGSVTVQYKINSGTADPWITAPSNPFTLTTSVLNRDGWIYARAFDGSFFSDEVFAVADFDTTPEVSNIYARYIVSSGVMYVTGSVDDDTKSLKWYIDNGAGSGDPTILSPALIDNLTSNKIFNFSFGINDGQRKIFKIEPYPKLAGLGIVGNPYREEIIRLPKTSALVKDRNLSGAVTKTGVQVTLSTSPPLPNAVSFERIKPIENGMVSVASINSITDSTKTWDPNQYATYWDVEIVGGKGLNQRSNIVSGSATTQSISPPWVVVPDSTSEYYIAETFRHYSDAGKTTSATPNSITDTTKSWIPNEFIGKDLIIYSGTGTGQSTTIVSGTITTQYFTSQLNPIPDNTSGYIINGPVNITRNPTEDIIVDYYSSVPLNNLTEETRSLSIDDDTVPIIKSGTFQEINAFIATITLFGPDDDTKYWSIWARKNNWPTITSGSAQASLDNDYLRFSSDINVTTLNFDATTGWWYCIVLPYDSYANPGPRTIFSGLIDGVGSTAAQLLSLQGDRFTAGLFNNHYHLIWWTHNSVSEKPGGNGAVTVKVFRRKPTDSDYIQISTDPRYAWQDSEDNDPISNSDDTLNSRVGRGSFAKLYNPGVGKTDYRIDLYDNNVFQASYYTMMID